MHTHMRVHARTYTYIGARTNIEQNWFPHIIHDLHYPSRPTYDNTDPRGDCCCSLVALLVLLLEDFLRPCSNLIESCLGRGSSSAPETIVTKFKPPGGSQNNEYIQGYHIHVVDHSLLP